MPQSTQISAFGSILLFLVLGTGFVLVTLFMSKLISPNKPNPEKLTTYECGEEPTGSSWIQFNMRFYVIALVFLLFDVELVFLFPWSTVFGNKELIAAAPAWGWLSFFEMTIFIAILLVGLLYVWKKGDLEWIKPQPVIPAVDVKVPTSLYQQINNTVYTIKPFQIISPEIAVPEQSTEKISERKLFFMKAKAEKEANAETLVENTSEKAEHQEKPKFKPRSAAPTDKTENTVTDNGDANQNVEKKAYTPKFKPQLAKSEKEKEEDSKATTEVNNPEPKQAYIPKFKPRVVEKSENSTVSTEDTQPIEETPKPAYKPKFKPQLVKKQESNEGEQTEDISAKSENVEVKEDKPAAPYKPKFKPQLVKKQNEPNEGEQAEDVSAKSENLEVKEVKPAAPYKPKFKPQLTKKQSDDSTDTVNGDKYKEENGAEKKEEELVEQLTTPSEEVKPTGAYKPRFSAAAIKKNKEDNN
ncbi:NADH-quinone oxidoreductase subunit A [Solitalea sp. MAHUQ-68]|uniref:NADH-quinone oxidoreductase subunit A n=1 Tax=Solitalea agri TaxID=2953739 RepID=A0A9X2JDL3_9SPHI|nr:NADH-quinone oxidoreductase subunit A [Solitalea agri]MCO4294592.1 NADH-quinone oxidoreductase subunit A [Solitalea agri]